MGLEKLKCPVCSNQFLVKIPPLSDVMHQTTDLRPVYRCDDLLPFRVMDCFHCGYACLIDEFDDEIPEGYLVGLRRLLRQEVGSLRCEHRGTPPLHVRFECAALIAERVCKYAQQIGEYWQMAAWSATEHPRLREEERYYRRRVVKYFRSALDAGEVDLSERAEICYLVGENYRRMGEQDKAEEYLHMVARETHERNAIRLAMQQIYDPIDV